ncbi:ABC transporter permease [Haloarchaeobius sp. DFWS5]|uniref:ABC transporter permease n=1 Tax=Haloarchaeobius sp. DFWS5 TaxID=3446114 RepID=UPI003EBC94B4
MSRLWYIARRFGFATFAAYIVLSVAFFVVATIPDPNLGMIARGARDQDSALAAVREAKNLDEPLMDRYVNWLVDYATFDWGTAVGAYGQPGAPITDILADAVPITLAYVLPGVVGSFVVALAVGSYLALAPESRLAQVLSSGSYLAFGVANYFLAICLGFVISTELGWRLSFPRDPVAALTTDPLSLVPYLVPAAVLSTTLAGGQLRYVRAESADILGEDFVKLVRSKGASDVRVMRHVLSNAALPLVSLVFADLLSVLVVQVYVLEFVFGMPGIGRIGLQAIADRNMPLIIGTTMVVAYAGIGANFLQDVAAAWFDPRAEFE